MPEVKNYRIKLALITVFILLSQASCTWLDTALNGFTGIVGLTDTATVISKSAQIRTSYAVVAADLLEVKRGEKLDVIDQVEFEKTLWYRVRARDETKTEGWIEAQHVITEETLEKSQKIAEQFKGLPVAGGRGRSEPSLIFGSRLT